MAWPSALHTCTVHIAGNSKAAALRSRTDATAAAAAAATCSERHVEFKESKTDHEVCDTSPV